ncbi:MAG TPA: class II aldolase/adducin family protein [Marmoricola sp.]
MDLRDEVAEAARTLAGAGLLIGTAGNVSARDGDRVAVTATGVVLGDCTADSVTLTDLDGNVIEGRLAPTSELGLHLRVYAETDAGAVVHTHAPFATACACVLDELPVLHYQQLSLGGAIRVAPYATFGTPELATSVMDALAGRQAALMANHGSVAIGATLARAVDNALLLEWLAALQHRASALGEPRVLTETQQHDVIAQAIALDYGSTKESQ